MLFFNPHSRHDRNWTSQTVFGHHQFFLIKRALFIVMDHRTSKLMIGNLDSLLIKLDVNLGQFKQ